MKRMKLVMLTLTCLLAIGPLANANVEMDKLDQTMEFLFQGQDVENAQLLEQKQVTRYRDEMQDSTCTRQVPYEEEVCGNVTHYRQECHTVPAHEECQDYNEQVCNDVIRYRQECHDGPSRQVCRTVPGRRVCRPGPSETRCHRTPDREVCENGPSRRVCRQKPDRRVCEDGPTRRVCTNKPDRQVCTDGPRRRVCVNNPAREVCRTRNGQRVCRQVPGGERCHMAPGERTCRTVSGGQVCRNEPGERRCRTVSGGQECHTVPGERTCHTQRGERVCRQVPGEDICHTNPSRRVCDTVPGDPICRDVPYTDTECHSETRTRCETVPDRQQCDQIPYQEWECHDETRYRDEEYACKKPVKVPYQAMLKTKGEVSFNFENFGESVKCLFQVKLAEGQTTLKVSDKSSTPYLIYSKVEQQLRDVSDLEKLLTSQYDLFFIEKVKALSPVRGNISLEKLSKTEMLFKTGRLFYSQGLKMHLKISKKSDLIFDGDLKLDDLNIEHLDQETLVGVDFQKYGFELKRGWGKKYNLEIKIQVDPQALHTGELMMDLTGEKLTLSKEFKKQKPQKN